MIFRALFLSPFISFALWMGGAHIFRGVTMLTLWILVALVLEIPLERWCNSLEDRLRSK